MRKTHSLDRKVEYDNGLTVRFLGITVDNSLFWRGHLDQLVLDCSAVYYIHDSHLPIFCSFNNLIRHNLLCCFSIIILFVSFCTVVLLI